MNGVCRTGSDSVSQWVSGECMWRAFLDMYPTNLKNISTQTIHMDAYVFIFNQQKSKKLR